MSRLSVYIDHDLTKFDEIVTLSVSRTNVSLSF